MACMVLEREKMAQKYVAEDQSKTDSDLKSFGHRRKIFSLYCIVFYLIFLVKIFLN